MDSKIFKDIQKSYLLLLTPLWGWPINLALEPRWSHMEDLKQTKTFKEFEEGQYHIRRHAARAHAQALKGSLKRPYC